MAITDTYKLLSDEELVGGWAEVFIQVMKKLQIILLKNIKIL